MTLEEVRKEIDKVDSQIKKLFSERMELAENVAKVKAETGDVILKPEREEIIISNLTEDVKPSIVKEYTALIKRIMEISRKYQYGITLDLRNCLNVNYLTEDVPVSTIAMVKPELYICNMYSKDKVLTVDTYNEIGDMISSNKVDAGVGILEDISVGVSDELHHTLTKFGLFINRCDVISENNKKKKVVSFSKNLIVKDDHNRLKLMFVCKNKSGSLSSILSMISDYAVNLTEIHSRPNMEKHWNYEFFVELDANLNQKEIQALVYQLMNETEVFKILGSYKCIGDFE